MDSEWCQSGRVRGKSENGLFPRGLEMAIRWKIAVHHGEAWFPGILVQGATDKQNRGLYVGRVKIFGKKIQKLRQPNCFVEFEVSVCRCGVFLGKKLLQFSNCAGELVRSRFRTMKYPCLRQSDVRYRFQFEGVINR